MAAALHDCQACLRLPRLTSALDILYCMAAGLAVFSSCSPGAGQLRLYLLGRWGGGAVFTAPFCGQGFCGYPGICCI